MTQPKLFTTLNTLTKDEWSSLRKYLLMYTRKDSDNYTCLQQLYARKNTLAEKGSDEKLREQCFPHMSPKVFSNMLSRLFSWSEDWMAIETFKNQPYERELMLVKSYNQRGLFKMANTIAQKLEFRIKKAKYLDINQKQKLAQLYHYQYFSSNPIKRYNGKTLLKDCIEQYIGFITEFSLDYLIELDNFSKIREIKYPDLQKNLEQLVKLSYSTPLAELLKLTLKMVRTDDYKSFMELKDHLESDIINPSSDLFLVLAMNLRKTSTNLWHKSIINNPEVFGDAYQLSFKAIEQNVNQKFIATNLFNGVSTIGTVLNYEQTTEFINKWISRVTTKYPESTLKYCRALNAFRHDRYELIPGLLSGLEFEKHVYKIISNVLVIIAQFKLGEEDLVITQIYNLKKQLKRNRPPISQSITTGLYNLLEIIHLLQKSRYDNSIVIKMEEYPSIFFKTWVLKEIGK